MSRDVDPKHIRDVRADTLAALIEEYHSYVRANRHGSAEAVALHLRDHYGHDVRPAKEQVKEPPEGRAPLERAVNEDAEVPEKPEEPVKRGPGRPRKNP